MSKVLAACVCALLAAILLWMMTVEPARPPEEPLADVTSVHELSGSLMMRKSNLMKQQEQIEKEYSNRIRGMGTVTLLFTQPDAVFMDIVAPMLTEVNFPGMVAFDTDTFPGKEGCITMEQWRQLEAAGWEICLKWDGRTLLPQWMDQMNQLLSDNGMNTSLTVLVPEDLFTQELIIQARQINLKAMLHHGEVRSVKHHSVIQPNDVWLPEVFAWYLDNTSETVEKRMDEGGSIVLEVYNEIIWDGGYRRLFKSMLEKLDAWQKEDRARVTTISEAISYRQGILMGSTALEEEMKAHLESLNVQIGEIDEQLDALHVGQ